MKYNMTREQVETQGNHGVELLDETWNTNLVRVLNSFDMYVLKEDTSIAPHLTNDGYWEAWITSWLTRWLRPGMGFIDIGANSGYYTLIADKLVGHYGSVVAYEPNPVYAELLRATRARNDATFKIREIALSDKVGAAELVVPDTLHGSASIRDKFKNFASTQTYPVKVGTLDMDYQSDIITRHDIIKIDAEGSEEGIWNGGQSLMNSHTHTTILMEYTPGAYSRKFLDDLFLWGEVTAITYDGGEQFVSKLWIETLKDWRMLVIRKR